MTSILVIAIARSEEDGRAASNYGFLCEEAPSDSRREGIPRNLFNSIKLHAALQHF